MTVSVYSSYIGKYTIQAMIAVSSGSSGEDTPIHVSADLENYWLRRLGFTIGTPEVKGVPDLLVEGLLDTVSLTRLGGLPGWEMVLAPTVSYYPDNPPGERLYFIASINGSGSDGAFIASIKLPHSIQH